MDFTGIPVELLWPLMIADMLVYSHGTQKTASPPNQNYSGTTGRCASGLRAQNFSRLTMINSIIGYCVLSRANILDWLRIPGW